MASPKRQKVGRKRRTHPGVKVLALSDGRHVARYLDPVSGKSVQVSLDRLGLSTEPARRAWATAKADQVAELRRAIELGGAVAVRSTAAQVVEAYLATVPHPPTRISKEPPLRQFVEFCEQNGVRNLDGLTLAATMRWRDDLLAGRPMASSTAGRWVGCVGAFLRWARRRGHVPRLSVDAIADATERPTIPAPVPDFLRPADLRAVLDGANQFSARFPKWREAAPIVLGLVLSGCRLAELVGLTWAEVQPDGLHLDARRVKTRVGRVVGFDVSPVLGDLFAALRSKAGAPESAAPVFTLTPREMSSVPVALARRYGCRLFVANDLRRTCGTLLTCAPAIYGAASVYLSARRLGHSVRVAERTYLGTLAGLPAGAKSIEDAAGVGDVARAIVAQVLAW